MPNFQDLNVFAMTNYIVVNIELVIEILGILGNSIVIFVFSRPNLNKYSYSFFMKAKALNDILFLAWYSRDWPKRVLDWNLADMNQVACVYSYYGDTWTATASQCLLLLISLDRLATVVYPNRFHVFKKLSFYAFLVLVSIIFSLLLTIMLALNANIIEIKNEKNSSDVSRKCYVASDVRSKQSWICGFTVLGSIIPATCFINWKLYRYIRESRSKVASYGHTQAQKIQKNDRKLAIVSIVQNVVALVFKNIGGMFIIIALTFLDTTSDLSSLIFSIGYTIFLFEAASSFFLNCFINSIFFNELMNCLDCLVKNYKSNSRSLTTHMVSPQPNQQIPAINSANL